MSLCWRNHYTAVVCPGQVSLIGGQRAWRRGFRVAYASRTDAPCDDGLPPADACAAALARLLAEERLARGGLSLLLSNHFVRYALVPWAEAITGRGELQALARFTFETVHGVDAARWTLQVSREKAGHPRVAAAVDSDLLAALNAAVADSKLSLTGIRPYLMTAFNRLARPLRRADFLFVLAEPTRTCLLAAAGGRWSAARSHFGSDAPEALTALIERESQLLGLRGAPAADRTPRPILVHAPRRAGLRLPPVDEVAPQTLAVRIPAALAAHADAALAMAMSLA